ncbi:hypothetical protein P4V47_26550 [Brevibacillus laterosporus]|uniref:hypothetical protein n=1 Tax=Brevibacillus laterosporus TaxID=1465 RepID=UPI0018CE67A1|nr:hypothetical protein [Brevibacillus laterosporus]MBG9790546.1 hypothetical protein [Brevibacillus laterosporus]MED1790978.1 hypothetical protein [Brevibacillus laterosporus]
MATLSAIGIVVGIISSVLVIVHTVSLLIKESKPVHQTTMNQQQCQSHLELRMDRTKKRKIKLLN